MNLRVTDEEEFVRESHEFFARLFPKEEHVVRLCCDVESIARYVVCDVDEAGHFRNDTITVKTFKTGRVYVSTAFNASYVWIDGARDWFEYISVFLKNNSWMVIYGEGDDVLRMRVKNGWFCVK